MRLLIKKHLGKFSAEFMLTNINSEQFQYIQNFTERYAHQHSGIAIRNKADEQSSQIMHWLNRAMIIPLLMRITYWKLIIWTSPHCSCKYLS